MRARIMIMTLATIAASTTTHAFTVRGQVVAEATQYPVVGARVEVFDVDLLPGGSCRMELKQAVYTDAAGSFTTTFGWWSPSGPPVPPNFESDGPDLLFRVTQIFDGATVVYDEGFDKTWWNVASPYTATFAVPGAQGYTGGSSAPNNNLFVFTRVGSTEVGHIDCRGDMTGSTGYANRSSGPYANEADSDQPFGGTLDLFGFFGATSGVNRYKIQTSTDNGATWSDVSTPLHDSYYEVSTHTWHTVSLGPVDEGDTSNLYKLPYVEHPDYMWAWFNRLAILDSRTLTDGRVRVKTVGYYWDGTALVPSGALSVDTAYGTIVLLVDNTTPQCTIYSVKLNNADVASCSFISLQTNDVLKVAFSAFDARGHLRDYSLVAMYGHNDAVQSPCSPAEATADYWNNREQAPTWTGGNVTVKYLNSNCLPSETVMPTCAYQLRLGVNKRTTNGYGLVYHNYEDTWHITIER